MLPLNSAEIFSGIGSFQANDCFEEYFQGAELRGCLYSKCIDSDELLNIGGLRRTALFKGELLKYSPPNPPYAKLLQVFSNKLSYQIIANLEPEENDFFFPFRG
ncbi:hypothetical protein BJP34_23730 [Moorena producens PAL-8-15-08-1]|uniref:Uncharacterized protein n=1 Tax=Moorena producens PAL-8-15-08-1 TaxID=1458985 RepID=A0A1D8TWL4_9CYAN|nr:hypothetical protein BJP34_23730 [Moorena producens PAL-8-15-08-1]